MRDVERLQRAGYEKILADPGATRNDKLFAQRMLLAIHREMKGRAARNKARKFYGPKPRREDFTSDAAYRHAVERRRDGLLKIAAEATLDDPATSLTQKRIARQTLEDVERRELKHGAAKTEPLAASREPRAAAREAPAREPRDELPEAAKAEFFKAIATGEEAPGAEAVLPPASAPVPPAPHAGPGDEDGEVCDKCLVPQKVCSCPKRRG